MAEYQTFQTAFSPRTPENFQELSFFPYWARSQVQYAQNLLAISTEPIEYNDSDEDYLDNYFFFPEDCSYPPAREVNNKFGIRSAGTVKHAQCDKMTALPDIKMIDTEALSDLLEDNLSPPEITSILIFATNGAIFAYASPLSPRQLRTLSATYGAAYTSYAKTASTGNLTGVNPTSHPSSFMTTPSVPLGDVGSIVFELDEQVAVVTKIADKVLLAAVGPSHLPREDDSSDFRTTPLLGGSGGDTTPAINPSFTSANGTSAASTSSRGLQHSSTRSSSSTGGGHDPNRHPDSNLEAQYEIDRSEDLARLAALNLQTPPEILLALESKSAALGRFLSRKLKDLESPEDF